MARHSTVLTERPNLSTRTWYTPQHPELRTRRAPTPPLWAKLCVVFGGILLLTSVLAYAAILTARG